MRFSTGQLSSRRVPEIFADDPGPERVGLSTARAVANPSRAVIASLDLDRQSP